MKTSQKRTCPVCGSTDIGLWNELKQTFHCRDCDCYFNKYGTIIEDSAPVYIQRGSGWNGFSDPDDFPNDGYGNSGW